jgi:tetratricopeptide (TPR) repeat protein
VFIALDTELNRDVALKEIQDRFADEPRYRSRFEFEAEVTGGLEHPGIVPVYGLGHTPDGRPFYAMRFIKGNSLKDAIRRFHEAEQEPRRISGQSTLELRNLLGRFMDVCDAVAYAHSRGVLHRDLKPGNIMLGKYGETLVVDWGLAKALDRPETEPETERSELPLKPASGSALDPSLAGSAVGTPAYMSPEQVDGRAGKLGVRSDVYCLGATLYHLLTGHAPCPGDEIGEIYQRILAGRIPRPRSINPGLSPALEAICLKSLSLRPQDRYDSAEALRSDVERWLADEPVSAWREPFSIRARRWARRNRTPVTGAVTALLAGLVCLAGVAVLQARSNALLRAANEIKDRALAAQTEAQNATETALAETRAAKNATDRALAQSEESRRQAEAVSSYLMGAFRSPDPSQDGRMIKVVDVLDAAAARLDKEFAGAPLTKGALLNALGGTYYGLGFHDRALELHSKARAILEAALGGEHPETLVSRNGIALDYYAAGRYGEAIALHLATLKLREAKLGPDHPLTLQSRNNLAIAYRAAGQNAEAIALHEGTLKLRESKLGPDHLDTLRSRNNLANAYLDAGRNDEAIALLEATYKRIEAQLGPDHPATLGSRSSLANAYYAASRYTAAIAHIDATLKLRSERLGPDHPDTLQSRNNLANAYRAAGRINDAIALHEATLKLVVKKMGPNHPDTLRSQNNLANAYRAVGRTADAIAMHTSTLKLLEARLGPDHPQTLQSRNNLAVAYRAAGRTAEAITLDEATLKLREARLGPDHPDTVQSRDNLADDYESLSRWSEAEHLRLVAVTRRRKSGKPDSELLADDLTALGLNLLKQARWSAAEPVMRECAAIRERAVPDGWARYDAMSLLGEALAGQGRYAEAEPLIVRGYEGMKAREAKIPAQAKAQLSAAAERVARIHAEWARPKQAAEGSLRPGLSDLPSDVFTSP